MTIAGPQDQPDYIRLSQAATELLLGLTPVACNAQLPTVGYSGYVGNIPNLYIFFGSPSAARYYEMIVTFCDDAALLHVVGSYTIHVDLTHQFAGVIPVLGNFVTVSVAALNGGAGASTIGVTLIGMIANLRSAQFVNPPSCIHVNALAVGAGAVSTQDLFATSPGDWQLAVTSSQVSLVGVVEQQFTPGVWLSVGQFETTTLASLVGRVALLAYPARVRVLNRAAAPADIQIILQPVT